MPDQQPTISKQDHMHEQVVTGVLATSDPRFISRVKGSSYSTVISLLDLQQYDRDPDHCAFIIVNVHAFDLL